MKKLNSLFVMLLFMATTAFAQFPQAINFQAIARDGNGDVMVATPIQIRLTVLDGSATGTEVYQELRALTTNDYGSFSFQIGRNANYVTIGSFGAIDWNTGAKFLKIDYDPTNQFNWDLTLGTIEFAAVPYAFSAENVTFIDAIGAQDGDVLVYNAASGKFEPGSVTATELDPIFAGSPANGISDSNILDWNTAFGWGNHANAGYLTEFTEADAIFVNSPAYGVTSTNITNWTTAYGWGNHAGLYRASTWLPAWTDVTGKPAFATVATSGSFADLTGKPTTLAGYGITNAMSTSHAANGITAANITNWTTAYGWGNHATAGYLTSGTETDPAYTAKFDLTNVANGDLLKYNGTKFVKFTPNYLSAEVDGSVTNEIELPTQTGNSGKFLSTNGTAPTWAAALTAEVDGSVTNEIELPTQTGNSGKVLTTNGTAASWTTVADNSATNEIELPTQTGNSGKVLTTNGTAASWTAVADNSATNEIQTLSLAGNALSLSNGGGSVIMPTSKYSSNTINYYEQNDIRGEWLTNSSFTLLVPANGNFLILAMGRIWYLTEGDYSIFRVFNVTQNTEISRSFMGFKTASSITTEDQTSTITAISQLNAGDILRIDYYIGGSGTSVYSYGGDGNGSTNISIVKIAD